MSSLHLFLAQTQFSHTWPWLAKFCFNIVYRKLFWRKSDKGQIFYWSSRQTALGSGGCMFNWSIVTMLKNLKTDLFQTFSTWHPNTFCPYCLTLTKCHPLLTQYHHVSTSTAFYWPSTTKYQPVLPYTDPVPPSINRYRHILTQYHHTSTSTTPYWPSTTKYQRLSFSSCLPKIILGS